MAAVTPTPLAPDDIEALRRVLWAPHQPPADVARWLVQGFAFAPVTPRATDTSFPLGLVQGHGGPCGVLAAVQAELLRRTLFPERTSLSLDARRTLLTQFPVDETAQRTALVQALASLLRQCVTCHGDRVRVVRRHQDTLVHVNSDTDTDTVAAFLTSAFDEVVVNQSDEAALERVLYAMLPQLQGPHGVVLFVWSVLRTRGIATVRDDMDDRDSVLTGQFGHCSQELLNLLLTGVASSNVFDGRVPMGDTGLVLRGVAQRPRLGYLTQLEALRYCHVGHYYKSPQAPVWVVGSASHFSVAVALDMSLCEASASLMLFQRMQRVFQSFDPMEAGFMDMGSLGDSLRQLGVGDEVVASDYWMAQLCRRLEVAGAGIILWDEYWRLVSVLVHTNDVELALSGTYANKDPATRAAHPKSDEDLARELQAQFDAEGQGTASVTPPIVVTPTLPATADGNGRRRFELYYYNGLSKTTHGHGQGTASSTTVYPTLKKALVTVEIVREFIGDTIPIELSTASGDGGHAGHPLEEILRTKWPSAQFTWEGTGVPSVD